MRKRFRMANKDVIVKISVEDSNPDDCCNLTRDDFSQYCQCVFKDYVAEHRKIKTNVLNFTDVKLNRVTDYLRLGKI